MNFLHKEYLTKRLFNKRLNLAYKTYMKNIIIDIKQSNLSNKKIDNIQMLNLIYKQKKSNQAQ